MSYYKKILKGATKKQIIKFFLLRGINVKYSGKERKFYFDRPTMSKTVYRKGKKIKIIINHLVGCKSIHKLINLKDVNFGKPHKKAT